MSAIQLNVELPFETLLEAVKRLSTKEKLLLNEAIWDEPSEIPAEQQELVRNRMQEAKSNPSSLLDWEQVKREL